MAKYTDVAPSGAEFFKPAKDSITSLRFITEIPKFCMPVWTEVGTGNNKKRVPVNSFAINKETGEIDKHMDCPILDLVPSTDPKDRPRPVHVYGIYNFDTNTIQLWQITQNKVLDAIVTIKEFAKKKRKSITDYRLTLSRTDAGKNFTEYKLNFDPDNEPYDEDQQALVDQALDDSLEGNIYERIDTSVAYPTQESLDEIGLDHVRLPGAKAKSAAKVQSVAARPAQQPVQKAPAGGAVKALRQSAPVAVEEPPADDYEPEDDNSDIPF